MKLDGFVEQKKLFEDWVTLAGVKSGQVSLPALSPFVMAGSCFGLMHSLSVLPFPVQHVLMLLADMQCNPGVPAR